MSLQACMQQQLGWQCQQQQQQTQQQHLQMCRPLYSQRALVSKRL
jgi:hypothetical protein